ncbi:ribonuclease H-like domain-containing protein [Tanacetum coccineum]
MLADSFSPNMFWAEAVSTACYVLSRVLVTKPQNKTPYELITGKIPIISYIRPFGCHVTILNTIDHLGNFDGKSYEGFLVGISLQKSTGLLKGIINRRSRIQANQHAGPQEANQNAGKEDIVDAVKRSTTKDAGEEPTKHPDFKQIDEEDQVFLDELERLKRQEQDANDAAEALRKEFAQETEDLLLQAGAAKTHTKQKILKKFDFVSVKTASTPIETQKPLVKDEEAVDVEYTLYIHKWFFNVTPKTSYLSVVKRIFRYLKGKPKLGLWYPRVSLFDLEAYSDSKLWLGAKLTGNPQQEVVNFLAGDLFLGNAKSRQLWLLLTIRGRNMLLLCAKLL